MPPPGLHRSKHGWPSTADRARRDMQTRFSNCGSDRQPVQCFCFPESSINITDYFHTSGRRSSKRTQLHSSIGLELSTTSLTLREGGFCIYFTSHDEPMPISQLVPRRCNTDDCFVFGTILKIRFRCTRSRRFSFTQN